MLRRSKILKKRYVDTYLDKLIIKYEKEQRKRMRQM